ncbi:PIN domain-like protein [Cryphonectria parasitica EP155]|uniref:PIN domain-like protein n=1 Tax=Cryphonectria parasitica (strain ATCC 38755 / EP155) TaxID=660469 RepID=A0A9P4Y027_CRYP1|nr:PIN domain-like protein [Cryphonectria parasitica EP155]KAF3764514.1 PIN domain-like protein [Cryphonectria parasitica EP155]
MGVQGLWQVLSPSARPTNLATLNRKRLAVDASIWIYQFLKAVRDKEGNALRNSHVVGFFRRICKLLWFGIKPVFVFDGGAPALKRATLQGRRRRREGRREDAVRTAGRLLAVQMQRIAEEEDQRRREARSAGRGAAAEGGGGGDGVPEGEVLPDVENMVYAEEAFTAKSERKKDRKFFRQDQYHLPELETSIEKMGRPDDPRIMSVEELEEYARQFNSGEDVNLYDFGKIDFDGDFFKSLPAADRYNILNAARVRSRLRMGLSKEQLEVMFPNRMDFSRFQIERVQERNRLTQRLMYEMNMAGTDLTVGGGGRVAGERNREYILVKNDGVEGGYALGVLTQEKDIGERHKPIDVDALQLRFAPRDEEDEDDWEDDEEFEDVPIEGVNRLPKTRGRQQQPRDNDDSLFVDNGEDDEALFVGQRAEDQLMADEDEDVARAIEMSLKNQHGAGQGTSEVEEEEFEDVSIPQWEQKAVDNVPKPITSTRGSMVAHIINNRANAAVPKKKQAEEDSDSEGDFQAALAVARKKKQTEASKAKPSAPIKPNVKNPFGGPLPFEKLDWRTSIFEKKPQPKTDAQVLKEANDKAAETGGGFSIEIPDGESQTQNNVIMEGGFEKEPVEDDAPRPLPPWMVHDDTDIRDRVKNQQRAHNEINDEDESLAREQEQLRRRRRQNEIVEIESSDDDDDDVQIIDAPPAKSEETEFVDVEIPSEERPPEPAATQITAMQASEEPSFEDVALQQHDPAAGQATKEPEQRMVSEEPEFEDVVPPTPPIAQQERIEGLAEVPDQPEADDDSFEEGEYDEFSDPEDEQLMAQLAEEAEEHARFASELNKKPAQLTQEEYERELRQLRNQQKKDRRDADEVTQIMVTECQALLRLFGIPYITAPMEAEAQCAELVSLSLVDGIVTDDSDIFLFGGTRVYKNMFNSNKLVECYLAADLEKDLSLSREQLISIAHLLGSDYTEGIPGIGPVTALEILSEFPGREGLVNFKEWWTEVQANPNRPKEADSGSSFRRKFRKSNATKLFLPTGFPSPAVYEAYLKPDVDHGQEPFQWGVPDLDGLRRFLMATIGWSQERTDEVLVPVIRDMNRRDIEGTQSNITRYFEGSVGVGAKEAFAPRQRAKGSRRMAAAVDKLRASTGKEGLPAVEESGEEEQGGEEAARSSAKASGKGTNGRKRKMRATAVADSDDADGDDDDEFVDEDRPEANGNGRRKKARGKGKGRKAKA